MKMLISRGLKIDPCSIPATMFYQELKEEPILVLCLRLFTKSKRIFKPILFRPYASNFAISKPWGIQS